MGGTDFPVDFPDEHLLMLLKGVLSRVVVDLHNLNSFTWVRTSLQIWQESTLVIFRNHGCRFGGAIPHTNPVSLSSEPLQREQQAGAKPK